MRTSNPKVVIFSFIFAIVLSLTVLTVTTIVFSELEKTTEDSNYGAMSQTTPYEHVILIVVDGVRPDILVGADTPNIDDLTASGSFTWNAWTVTPSVTIAAIPSIFTGATPEVHGVTDWDGEIYAETIVEVFEEAGLHCAIVGEDPILGGYSATYCTGYYSPPYPDENFMSTAINLLWENDFYFISVYNPMPDKRGHSYGHDSPEYREAIENADYHIGRLVENLKELGVYDNTLIVITTDHGMTGTSHSHGYETDMRIFSVWHGPGVKQGYEMADSIYIPASGTYDETYVAHRIIDIAPTMTELVGVRPPENAEGEIIEQIFEGTLTPHDPIYIDGNDNFTPANGVVGGSGAENDPYIIENWDISAENDNGIEIRNTTTYFIIRNCYVHDGKDNNHFGIYFDNATNGKIDNSIIENNYYSILLYLSDNNTISNNTCEDCWSGIYLAYSDNNLVENNIVENNSVRGISLVYSNNNFILNNTMEHIYDGDCIYVYYSDNNIISNNIMENNWEGIYLYSSYNNLIANNTVENNFGRNGIFLHYSNNNTISNNTVVGNNSYGIYLFFYSDNNLIFHNEIVNNGTQAYDNGSNYWDNGYPSGGNYWSDYAGVDYYQGENQDIPGSDGIGDSPYNISGGSNKDRYPLRELSLVSGWNLISFWKVSENTTPDNIFAGQTYYIWKWDPVGKTYTSPSPTAPVELGVGYWVWVDYDQTVATSGIPVENYSIDLVAGWNLVGFPVTNVNTTPDNLFAGQTYYIWEWNPVSKNYVSPPSNQPVELGVGYWVWVGYDQTVTVPL